MQITKEQMVSEIAQTKANIENAKAQVHQLTGALVVLENIQKYLDTPTPEPEASTHISEENRAIQDRDMSMQDLAELVAGPGATAEIEPLMYDAEEESLDYANR